MEPQEVTNSKKDYVHVILNAGNCTLLSRLFDEKIVSYFNDNQKDQSPFFYLSDQSHYKFDREEQTGKLCVIHPMESHNHDLLPAQMNCFQYINNAHSEHYYEHKSGNLTLFRPLKLGNHSTYGIEFGYFGDKFYYKNISVDKSDIYQEHDKHHSQLVKCIKSQKSPSDPKRIYFHNINELDDYNVKRRLASEAIQFNSSENAFPLAKTNEHSFLRETSSDYKEDNSVKLSSVVNNKKLPEGTIYIAVLFPHWRSQQSQLISKTIDQRDLDTNFPEEKCMLIDPNKVSDWKIIAAMREQSLGYKFVAIGKDKNGQLTNLTKIGRFTHTSSEEKVKDVIHSHF